MFEKRIEPSITGVSRFKRAILLLLLIIIIVVVVFVVVTIRPDITVMVGWAVKIN